MKTKILSVFAFALVALLSAQAALASPSNLVPPHVPEIDASVGLSAIALLSGVIALLAERRKRWDYGFKD